MSSKLGTGGVQPFNQCILCRVPVVHGSSQPVVLSPKTLKSAVSSDKKSEGSGTPWVGSFFFIVYFYKKNAEPRGYFSRREREREREREKVRMRDH